MMQRREKRFDLLDRTQQFARDTFQLTKQLPTTTSNRCAIEQLVRSASSVGANYIEANEALGKKDFALHLKISRKEAKESRYWLQLLDCPPEILPTRDRLIQESTELLLIFSSMVRKASPEQ